MAFSNRITLIDLKHESELMALLSRFMRENNVLEKYCVNFIRYHGLIFSDDSSISDRVQLVMTTALSSLKWNRYNLVGFININEFFFKYQSAFAWEDTPEGCGFWNEVNKKWNKFWNNYRGKYEVVQRF